MRPLALPKHFGGALLFASTFSVLGVLGAIVLLFSTIAWKLLLAAVGVAVGLTLLGGGHMVLSLLIANWSSGAAAAFLVLVLIAYMAAREERGDALGNWGAVTVISAFVFLACFVVSIVAWILYWILS